jgi:hypothetical protein
MKKQKEKILEELAAQPLMEEKPAKKKVKKAKPVVKKAEPVVAEPIADEPVEEEAPVTTVKIKPQVIETPGFEAAETADEPELKMDPASVVESANTWKRNLTKLEIITGCFLAAATIFLSYYGYVYVLDAFSPKPQPSTDKKVEINSVTPQADPYEGWLTYTNEDIGYTLRYPKDWTIKETNGTSQVFEGETAKYLVLTNPNGNWLHFGFGKNGATYHISERTGVGAGEDSPIDKLKTTLLGSDIIPSAHIWEAKTKEYFYRMTAAEKVKCNCDIAIFYEPPITIPYENINMSTEDLPTVNKILASVTWSQKELISWSADMTKVMTAAEKVLDARKDRSLEEAKAYVTATFLQKNTQASFAGVSSPSFGKYTQVSAKNTATPDLYEVTATVHWMLQGEETGTSEWKLYVVNQNGKFLVNEIKGDY